MESAWASSFTARDSVSVAVCSACFSQSVVSLARITIVRKIIRDPNRMMNFGTSFDVEKGVARKDRTHGQTLTTR